MREQDQSSVSVIIPVYNCQAYLAEAIDSVLSQTCPPGEIIVVDDGSSDDSRDVAMRYSGQVRYVHQENQGIGAARNRGVDLAAGDLLAFLDADDVWLPNKLAIQMAAFESKPDLDMVLGQVEQFVTPELSADARATIGDGEQVMPGYVAGTVLVKRDSFLRVGPFSTDWRVGEFMDWYAKAREAGLRDVMLPDIVTRRRIHTSNVGIRERKSQGDYVRILKAALDRRRQAPKPDAAEEHPDR
jgi:glycosyltransferase involved in cell wall biosynthesis